MVFCCQNCFDLLREKTFEIRGWRPRICNVFEITRAIYSNSERSEQFLVTECFFNLFLEVSQIYFFRFLNSVVQDLHLSKLRNLMDFSTCKCSNISCTFLHPNDFFFNLNSDCSNSLNLRNLQEQVKKHSVTYLKLFWPFTVWVVFTWSQNFCKLLAFSLEFQKFFLITSTNFFSQ